MVKTMVANELKVLFLGKRADSHGQRALAFCRENFGEVTACDGQWGEPLPVEARQWRGDLLVSYLSRWVVPQDVLNRAGIAAINFHPATPEYPGIGCNNFALYENAASYGATCHHMSSRVDTGALVAVTRFPVLAEDTVATLLGRTYDAMLELFFSVMSKFKSQGVLPASGEHWSREPFTRKQFEELRRITPDMDAAEVQRRIRATDFPPWGPYVDMHGHRFRFEHGTKA
jgi:methionyl-tRNA formyltransferase